MSKCLASPKIANSMPFNCPSNGQSYSYSYLMGIVDIAYTLSVKVSSLQLSSAPYNISSVKSSMSILRNPHKSSRRITASASSSSMLPLIVSLYATSKPISLGVPRTSPWQIRLLAIFLLYQSTLARFHFLSDYTASIRSDITMQKQC